MAFWRIDPKAHRPDSQSNHQRSTNKKISRQNTFHRFLKGIRWSGYYEYMVSPKKLISLWWSFTKHQNNDSLTWYRHQLLRHYCRSLTRRNTVTQNVFWMSIDLIKENGFTLKKARSRQYPNQIMTDTNHTNNLHQNTPAQTKSLLHWRSTRRYWLLCEQT